MISDLMTNKKKKSHNRRRKQEKVKECHKFCVIYDAEINADRNNLVSSSRKYKKFVTKVKNSIKFVNKQNLRIADIFCLDCQQNCFNLKFI